MVADPGPNASQAQARKAGRHVRLGEAAWAALADKRSMAGDLAWRLFHTVDVRSHQFDAYRGVNVVSGTVAAITELVFLEQSLEKADFIFVFGNDWVPTMEVVAEMYHQGASDKIIISGHSARADRPISEARHFTQRGIELGIPAQSMLLEERATNTRENLLNSLPIMEGALAPTAISSILFVCKTFHTRRVLMTARQIFPDDVAYGFRPVGDERDITRENWPFEKSKRNRVLAEVRRVGEYAEKGDISIL